MVSAHAATASHSTERPPSFARRPVWAISVAAALFLLLGSMLDGYFEDELYFLSAAKNHLSWGYADQPPLVPVLTWLMDALVPGSVVAVRIPAILITVAGVVLAAMTARELGGGRRAQTMAAGAHAISFHTMIANHWLGTASLDPLWWTLILWLVVRWVRVHQDHLLLWAGVVSALAMQTKYLVPVLWIPLVISALVLGPRELLRRPLLWVGAGIAVLASAPSLWWQAVNGWPQLQVASAVAAEAELTGGRLMLLPYILAFAGVLVGALLCCYGLWHLLRSPALQDFRFLGWTVIGVLALVLATNGHSRYAAGVYALLFAAGAVEFERRSAAAQTAPGRWWRWMLNWPGYVVSVLLAVVMFANNMMFQVPRAHLWPRLAAEVGAAYQQLSADQRERTTVLAGAYENAAALERFGQDHGLPAGYSHHRGYWFFGAPADRYDAVLYVGKDIDHVRGHFTEARQLGKVDGEFTGVWPLGPNEQQVWLCTGRREPWEQLWPKLKVM